MNTTMSLVRVWFCLVIIAIGTGVAGYANYRHIRDVEAHSAELERQIISQLMASEGE